MLLAFIYHGHPHSGWFIVSDTSRPQQAEAINKRPDPPIMRVRPTIAS